MATADRRTQVYIVDDSLTIRAMMDTLLGRDEDFDVCGMAAEAETALDDVELLMPDVVLLDLTRPGTDGLAFLDGLQARWRPISVIVFSRSENGQSMACNLALDKGAAACFDKPKLIDNWHDLTELMGEVRASHGLVTTRDGSPVTLLPLGQHEPPLDASRGAAAHSS